MKKYVVDYYKKFKCLAKDCPDTCCAAWKICIDDETLAYYQTVGGDFGNRLAGNMTSDADGDTVFRLSEKRCPFLNAEQLCDIHIVLGEAHTCAVCREHPRFTEIYDGFTEISLSASCPAANSIIFSTPLSKNTYPVPEYNGSDELLEMLIMARECVLDGILRADSPQQINDCLQIQTEKVADRLYDHNNAFDKFYHFNGRDICEFETMLLTDSEILTDEWQRILHTACEKTLSEADFSDYSLGHFYDIKKAYAYFVYRFFLKSVNDEFPELNSAFIALCLTGVIDIAAKTDTDFAECFRLFSKETEHDLENIDLIKDFIAEKGQI